MDWLSTQSFEDHDSQEISKEKESDEVDHSLPDWLSEIHLTDTEDLDTSFRLLEIDQKFSDDYRRNSEENQDTKFLTYYEINEKPRPDFDRLQRKPTSKKWKKAKKGWPKIFTSNTENQYKYMESIKPSSQSSPKISPTSHRVAQHRKKLSSKRLNFDI